MSKLKDGVAVHEATHVKVPGGTIERIVSKYGVDDSGRVAPPSQGGFGVVTESGRMVSMWDARSYLREEKE